MDTNKIAKGLGLNRWLGKKIHFKEEIASTNSWALKAVKEKAARGEVFLTDYQTQGHGRLDRHWESPPGKNILMSLIDHLPSSESQTPHLTLIAGVSFLKALEQSFSQLQFQIKWPNDILLSGKKVGGILCERHGTHKLAVIGLGLNVNMFPQDFSSDLAQTATSLQIATGSKIKREKVVTALLINYENWRETYDTYGLAPIINVWKKKTNLIHKKVKVTENATSYEGIVEGMDEDGFLIVNTQGKNQKVISGDITLCF